MQPTNRINHIINVMFSYLLQLLLVWALILNTEINGRIGKVEGFNIIRVCQNKHCFKKNKDVLQTIHNLADIIDDEGEKIMVQSSGCVSQCDLGPNIEVTTGNKETPPTLLNGMADAQTIAFRLGELSTTSSFPPLPKILIAASKVIEQSEKFAANGRHEEQIKYLTSVIDKFENSLSLISSSTTANAQAHALRAQGYLRIFDENKDDNSQNDKVVSAIHDAKRDAKRVVKDLSAVATPLSLSLAFRAWTDAELILAKQQQQKHKGEKKDLSKAVAVLSQWHRTQPVYRTKLTGEIQRLLLSMES